MVSTPGYNFSLQIFLTQLGIVMFTANVPRVQLKMKQQNGDGTLQYMTNYSCISNLNLRHLKPDHTIVPLFFRVQWSVCERYHQS